MRVEVPPATKLRQLIHESTTNPRRTFDEAKLYELAESIRHNGLIQPLTVQPNNKGFEIVAGARRYRAAHLAELFSVPARIVEIDDAKALEWQLVENSKRVDVHPYEEAQGFQRIVANAPAAFSPAQLCVLLRAIVNLDPYTFADDLADDLARENENEQRTVREGLLSTIDTTTDDKVTVFTIPLALAGHRGIPREGECDFLTEAEIAFVPPPPQKKSATKKAKQPKPLASSTKSSLQKTSGKKKVADLVGRVPTITLCLTPPECSACRLRIDT